MEGHEKMGKIDLRLPTPLSQRIVKEENLEESEESEKLEEPKSKVRKLELVKKAPLETTIQCIQYLAEMEVGIPIIAGEPDMYRFIYNINRIRRNTLPNEFKYLSKGRRYITLNLPELDSLLVIRVK